MLLLLMTWNIFLSTQFIQFLLVNPVQEQEGIFPFNRSEEIVPINLLKAPLVLGTEQKVGCFYVFCYLGFLSRTFANHRTAGEGRGHFFNSSLPLPPASPATLPQKPWHHGHNNRNWLKQPQSHFY